MTTTNTPAWFREQEKVTEHTFVVGQRVEKVGGDYSYSGVVVAVIIKRSGVVRIVVEDDRGLLFIFNPSQLKIAVAVEQSAARKVPTRSPQERHRPRMVAGPGPLPKGKTK
jgi:hypothetical protein